ncbi:rubredoxin [Streptomyces ureilyticus]
MNTSTEVVRGRAWMCLICGWVYYEDLGLPEEGIPPGTAWEDIPDDWSCPDCGVSKADFVVAPL